MTARLRNMTRLRQNVLTCHLGIINLLVRECVVKRSDAEVKLTWDDSEFLGYCQLSHRWNEQYYSMSILYPPYVTYIIKNKLEIHDSLGRQCITRDFSNKL